METSQKLLFSEPYCSENGIWCDLHPELDPAQWARLCRFIGNLSPSQFDWVENVVMGSQGRTGSISFKAVGSGALARGVSGSCWDESE